MIGRGLKFKLFICSLIISVLCPFALKAQDGSDKETEALNWFADHIENSLTRFSGLRHDSSVLPQKYVIVPLNKGVSNEFGMALATWDESFTILFTRNGNDVKSKIVTKEQLPGDIYWQPISFIGVYKSQGNDITLSQRPIPVRTTDKNKNRFVAVVEYEEKINGINDYNTMIFKPHANDVKLVSSNHNVKKDEMGNILHDEMEYTFSLKNPQAVKTMFRGYDDDEMVPWVVKKDFFKNHTILQYSRWKEGEKKVFASVDEKQIISRYYNGRIIDKAMWIATCESAERKFFAVQFKPVNGDALAAMVCLAEGEVVSTWEFHGTVDENEPLSSIWFVDDEGDFIEHAPEIHCMAATPAGLELYIRQYGGESVQYHILREVEETWLEIQSDYWIYVW